MASGDISYFQCIKVEKKTASVDELCECCSVYNPLVRSPVQVFYSTTSGMLFCKEEGESDDLLLRLADNILYLYGKLRLTHYLEVIDLERQIPANRMKMLKSNWMKREQVPHCKCITRWWINDHLMMSNLFIVIIGYREEYKEITNRKKHFILEMKDALMKFKIIVFFVSLNNMSNHFLTKFLEYMKYIDSELFEFVFEEGLEVAHAGLHVFACTCIFRTVDLLHVFCLK